MRSERSHAPAPVPAYRRLAKEARAFREIPRLLLNRPVSEPAPTPALVVMVPGLGAHDVTLGPLGRYLAAAGHVVFDSALGLNVGALDTDLVVVSERVRDLSQIHRRRVSLVGWSMGGVVAREVARAFPGSVERVVTFGTPLEGPRYTSLAFLFNRERTREIERRIAEARVMPITVPITAIYSRNDGIVDWRSCIDRDNAEVRHVEVEGAHLSMNIDPDVWRAVAQALTLPRH